MAGAVDELGTKVLYHSCYHFLPGRLGPSRRMCAALPPPALRTVALCLVSLHFGMCLSAVSSAKRLPQCGQGTRDFMKAADHSEEDITGWQKEHITSLA